MKKPKANGHGTPVLPGFEPVFYTPTITTRLPDGSMMARPGQTILLKGEDEITTAEFSKKSGLSQRHIITLIEQGQIKARPLSPLPNSRWRIPRSELARYLKLEKE